MEIWSVRHLKQCEMFKEVHLMSYFYEMPVSTITKYLIPSKVGHASVSYYFLFSTLDKDTAEKYAAQFNNLYLAPTCTYLDISMTQKDMFTRLGTLV